MLLGLVDGVANGTELGLELGKNETLGIVLGVVVLRLVTHWHGARQSTWVIAASSSQAGRAKNI